MFNIQSNSFICHSAFLRHTICCASAQADLLNHSRWTFCMTLREYPFRYESKKIFLPDLESLKTDTTWRRKLVSCSALLVFWFLGVISSWHHSGPNALKEIHNKVQSCFELSEINVKLKYKNCKFNQIFPGPQYGNYATEQDAYEQDTTIPMLYYTNPLRVYAIPFREQHKQTPVFEFVIAPRMRQL